MMRPFSLFKQSLLCRDHTPPRYNLRVMETHSPFVRRSRVYEALVLERFQSFTLGRNEVEYIITNLTNSFFFFNEYFSLFINLN
jgi:hypothetical protein